MLFPEEMLMGDGSHEGRGECSQEASVVLTVCAGRGQQGAVGERAARAQPQSRL